MPLSPRSPDLATQFQQKIERGPLRVGLPLGFLGVPLAWMVQDAVLKLVWPWVRADWGWSEYFVRSALWGAIFTGCALQAWAAWRRGDLATARWTACLAGFGGSAIWMWVRSLGPLPARVAINGWEISPRVFEGVLQPMMEFDLPLYGALALLAWGLFARRRI